MNRISVIALPVIMMSALALGGCTQSQTSQKNSPTGTYVSNTGGASFDQSVQVANTPDTTIASFDLGKIHRATPDSATVFMAAGKDGVVISHDDGATWTAISLPLAAVIDVTQTKSGVLIASGVDASAQGIITRSIDSGKTWQNVLTLPGSNSSKQFQIIKGTSSAPATVVALEVDPLQDNRIWAATNDGTIFVGEQYGKTWRKLVDISTTISYVTGDRSGAGVVRMIPSTVSAGELLVITKDKRLLKIQDGKVSEIQVPVNFDQPTPFGIDTGSQKVLNAMYIPDLPNALLVGTDTGVVITKDGGKSWIALKLPLDASKTLSSVALAVSPTNTQRMFVVADGVMYRSEDNGTTWNTTEVGPAGYPVTDISIDPANAARMLAIVKSPSA